MAKKIRFPLEMENGVMVRSMEELREHFSLVKVLEYYKNGKLVIWLRDRYANDIADAVEALDENEQELAKKISEIFDVPYDEKEFEKAVERPERLKRLKQFTEDEKFLEEVDKVAFEQDELYDLLDEDAEVIYLCGERFSIPLSKESVSYIGINNPVAVIDSKDVVNWEEKKISVEGVTFDEKYQAVVNAVAIGELVNFVVKGVRSVKKHLEQWSTKIVKIGEYSENSYLNFMMSPAEKDDVRRMYDIAKTALEKLNYDINADIRNKKNLVLNSNLIGIAEDYLNRL